MENKNKGGNTSDKASPEQQAAPEQAELKAKFMQALGFAIRKFAVLAPEDDEDWESWYSAAFDMLSGEVEKELDLIASPTGKAEAEPSQKPVARLQAEVSDRPFSEGKTHFEIVILDRDRCEDGMELYAYSLATQASFIAADRDAVPEEAARVCDAISQECEQSDVHKSFAMESVAGRIRALKSTSSAASQTNGGEDE